MKYAVTKNITEKELIQNGVRIKTATEQRISALVEYMVDYGTHNTEDGNSYLYFNDLPETEDFISDNAEAISYALERREEVADVAIIEEKEGNFFSVNFEIDYCPIMLLQRLPRLVRRAVIQHILVLDAEMLTKIILPTHTGIITNRLFNRQLVLNTGERFLPVSSVGIRTTKTTELFRQDITIQTQ